MRLLSLYTGVHLTEVRPGRPSGECFVEVESQQDVDEALKKDKENMGKRYIESKLFKLNIFWAYLNNKYFHKFA